MILAKLNNSTNKDQLVRVLVKSTKTCRITFDTKTVKVSQDGFLVPSAELTFVDQVQGMVDAVKVHAKANYDKDGWDIVVESYEDSDIANVVKTCHNNEAAIRRMHGIMKMLDDRRKDVQATAY